jgi:TolB-like protein/DNA-binding winged helix-turn-helix (wHTH) protein/Tfp pilus assembly protein PilF
MATQVQASRVLQFGAFEVDLRTGSLRKSGARIKLQEQPFQILAMLLEKPGDMVTREELRRKLWPADTFVDFDNGLNTAIKKLRDTLGDLADSPRFIETLPKRGYRFIYPVNGARAPADVQVHPIMSWWRQPWAVGLLALAALLATALAINLGGLRDRITGRTGVGPIASVAVLPCKNLTGDPEQEFLSDGLTDVLTTHLAQVKSLTVPSVTSSMYFKGEHKRLSEIARELGVQAMVEPSVQRSGDRLLLNLQLIYAPTDRHLWAKSYEVDAKNVQALLTMAAREILEAMNAQVTPEERSRLSSSRETTPEAYEAYMRGEYHARKGTDADRAKAHEFFEKAIEKDPNFALAYASLAVLRAHGGFFRAGTGPLDARTQTREWARRALKLDDTLAEAHAALAWIEMDDWNWTGAEQEFRRAIELNPNLPVARTWYAQFLSSMRRFEESFAQAEIARRLDPASPDTSVHSAEPYLNAGRVDEAIESYRKVLELEPNYYIAHHNLARAYIEKGMYQQAIEELEKAMALGGRDSLSLGVLAHAYGKAGRPQEALKLVNELLQRPNREHVPPWRPLAIAYSGLGDKDKAFACLETAYERRSGALFELNSQLLYAPLRSDPRFQDLARRIGLPSSGTSQPTP